MVYPANHYLLTVYGDGWGLEEYWQFGLRLASGGTPPWDDDELQQALQAATGLISSGRFTNAIRLIGIKVAPIGTDGRYVPGRDSQEVQADPPVPGGNSGQLNAPQISLVVSLRTDKSRGYGSKGRIYPPTPGVQNGATGRVAQSFIETYIETFTTFLDAINGIGKGAISVMSSVGAGVSLPVTSIRVGDVLDTQRRRREQLPEVYFSGPLDPP